MLWDEIGAQELEGIISGSVGVDESQFETENDGLVREDRAMTLREIGDIMGISKERVRQIEKTAMWKMRGASRRRVLQDFVKG